MHLTQNRDTSTTKPEAVFGHQQKDMLTEKTSIRKSISTLVRREPKYTIEVLCIFPLICFFIHAKSAFLLFFSKKPYSTRFFIFATMAFSGPAALDVCTASIDKRGRPRSPEKGLLIDTTRKIFTIT
jgi:hypothetical protein